MSDTVGTTTPISWLQGNVPGFNELSEAEREAVMHFTLLWSLFEGRVLQRSGNAKAILRIAHRWHKEGNLQEQTFEDHLDYFRNRYFANGNFTHHFPRLHLRDNDNPELVKAVLRGESNDLIEVTAAVLILIYRFRNNLFHGLKWEYEIRGQLDNFSHANSVLMKALELNGNL